MIRERSLRIGWAAGLIDGEGSIAIYNGRVMLRINMCEAYALERFRRIVGVGTVKPQRPRRNRKNSYRWYAGAYRDVRFVLRMLLPSLVVKREHAMLALLFLESGSIREKVRAQRNLKRLICEQGKGRQRGSSRWA
jgi:hypothetical protein